MHFTIRALAPPLTSPPGEEDPRVRLLRLPSVSVSVTHVLHCTEGLLTLLQACFKNLSLAMRHPTNLAKNLSLGSEPVRS